MPIKDYTVRGGGVDLRIPQDDEERDYAGLAHDQCCAEGTSYVCTRSAGHTGKHVAHGGPDWVCATWKDNP